VSRLSLPRRNHQPCRLAVFPPAHSACTNVSRKHATGGRCCAADATPVGEPSLRVQETSLTRGQLWFRQASSISHVFLMLASSSFHHPEVSRTGCASVGPSIPFGETTDGAIVRTNWREATAMIPATSASAGWLMPQADGMVAGPFGSRDQDTIFPPDFAYKWKERVQVARQTGHPCDSSAGNIQTTNVWRPTSV
jgi:hypothetical protein